MSDIIEVVQTSDLKVEEQKLPMTLNETVLLINESLENTWTIEDKADGKEIDVFKEWYPFIEELIWKYRHAGWEVFRFLNKGREYLSFTNPDKRRFCDPIRG